MSVAQDEVVETRVIKQHSGAVSLVGVYGNSENRQRERLLGYILLHAGTPRTHLHTWYMGIAFTAKDDIRRKDPSPLYTDNTIRFWKVGIGTCDYYLCLRGHSEKHDEAGLSDGAAHLNTKDQWKDGL